MHAIGVIHLDQLAKTEESVHGSAFLDKVAAHVESLEHCHSIKKWILMARSPVLRKLEAELGHKARLSFVATPERDALDTFYRVAVQQLEFGRSVQAPGNIVLRVTPGTDALDAESIDTMLRNHRNEGYDYSSNNMLDDGPSPTVEIMNLEVLNEAWREALLPDDRDLITPYITRQHQRLNLGRYQPGKIANSKIETTYF